MDIYGLHVLHGLPGRSFGGVANEVGVAKGVANEVANEAWPCFFPFCSEFYLSEQELHVS